MVDGLTIGQAAAFAGITVRHYHRLGLLAEPARDGSGYRRCGSAELLRLVQVRTLAGAGVPLAEIAELLDADPARFAAAVDDVRRRLTVRIEELASAPADNLPADRARPATPPGVRNKPDAAARYGTVNHHRSGRGPSITRLNALVETNLRAAGVEGPHQ